MKQELCEGVYLVRALSAKAFTSKKKGTPGIEIVFKFEDDITPRTIVWNGWLTDGSKARTLEALRTCGWDGNDFRKFNGIGNNVVSLTVDRENYTDNEGKERFAFRANWVNAISREISMTPDELDEFEARFADCLTPVTVAEQPLPEYNSEGGDVIPF